jgi:hypothetical protein
MIKKFVIYKPMDARTVRYYLHQIPHTEHIHPKVIARVREIQKTCDKRITLTTEEENIINDFGKGINFVLNCVIYQSEGE